MDNDIIVEVIPQTEESKKIYDLDRAIFDLNSQIDLLISKADMLDYVIAAASGIVCGIFDLLWVGEFDLSRGRKIASEKVENLVKRVARLLGSDSDDIKDCVIFLEKRYPLPTDGNMNDFGGALQHHFRDFAHHPTIAGLAFSLLTQFTGYSFGTDTAGRFIFREVPEKSKIFIGDNIISKIFNGTVIWFFHLVSDMAGSSNTAGLGGGTGIPGPILALAKELSTLPLIRDIRIKDRSLSEFLSKLFNGTLLAHHDADGRIIKDSVLRMDLRGEMGAILEVGRQALPVLANETIVRSFYFIRRLGTEIKRLGVRSLEDFKKIDWNNVYPKNSATLSRMLTISTSIFTTVDLTGALLSGKTWISVNYIGIARFALAIGEEIAWALRRQELNAIKKVYETIRLYVFNARDNRIYERISGSFDTDKLGLSLEEIEILYNIELFKTLYDIEVVRHPIESETIKNLKRQWLIEWRQYLTEGFQYFVQIEGAELHWYSYNELIDRIRTMDPSGVWYKLVLLEAMVFQPYFILGTEIDKNGKEVPSKKYRALNTPGVGYSEKWGDKYIESVFSMPFNSYGFIERLRSSHTKALNEMNEVLKNTLKFVSITGGVIILTLLTAGTFAPQIATALVGSKFAGLSGAALTNACLAYLGGGAVAAGGLGMAGGHFVIVGGGALLGLGVGSGAGGITAAVGLGGKKATILNSAKLIVSMKEIFLNEEKDLEFSQTVYEQYVKSIAAIEKELVDLKLQENVALRENKKKLTARIKNTEESLHVMKIAMRDMYRGLNSYVQENI